MKTLDRVEAVVQLTEDYIHAEKREDLRMGTSRIKSYQTRRVSDAVIHENVYRRKRSC